MSAHRPNQKWNDLRYKFKLSREQYEAMVEQQEGKCLICQKPTEKLNVDHDHSCCPGRKTCGKCVRGLLCKDCNTTLGHHEWALRQLTAEKGANWVVGVVRYLTKKGGPNG